MKRMPDGSFIVDSTSGADRAYRVTVEGSGTCTCPHFTYRLVGTGKTCRHIDDLRAELAQQTALGRAADKAAGRSDADLMTYSRKRNGTAAGAACLLELAARKLAAVQPEPKPIPAGVLVLLEGATAEERERALAIYR